MRNKTIIYPNLLAEIARQGITIAGLADILGVTRSNMYNKLNGKTNFSLKDIKAIQDALRANDKNGDYSLDYLFYKSGE